MQQWLDKFDMRLPKKISSPFLSKYQPELDVTEELEDEPAKFYQSMVGYLRWLVEMGRLDVCTEVSQLSSFLTNPRYGHFLVLVHLFS